MSTSAPFRGGSGSSSGEAEAVRCVMLLLLLAVPVLAQNTLDGMSKLIQEVSDRLKPSVVHIEVLARRGENRRKGLGSGLIISPDGKIVTNQHVIDKAEYIAVILDDKTKHEAKVLRQDRQTDLALLQIQAGRPLPAARLADSDKVSVGEWVLAIGNPYGFDRTVSFGIISGKGRYIPDANDEVPLLNDFLQTDALIDPGSSGGPLVNLKGEVIGINSVGIGRGQGFTIPAKVVQEVTTRTQVEGRIERGWVGVYLQPFPSELATYMGLGGKRGILVSDVHAGSPADRAGIRSGDVIVAFAGSDVEAEQEEGINRFAQLVSSLSPGARVPVLLLRERQPRELTLEVGTQPAVDSREVETGFGFTAKEINTSSVLEYRLDSRKGALVSYVTRAGAADEAGLDVGDVIVRLDDHEIAGVDDLIAYSKGKKRFLLQVRRGKLLRYALVDLERYKSKT